MKARFQNFHNNNYCYYKCEVSHKLEKLEILLMTNIDPSHLFPLSKSLL